MSTHMQPQKQHCRGRQWRCMPASARCAPAHAHMRVTRWLASQATPCQPQWCAGSSAPQPAHLASCLLNRPAGRAVGQTLGAYERHQAVLGSQRWNTVPAAGNTAYTQARSSCAASTASPAGWLVPAADACARLACFVGQLSQAAHDVAFIQRRGARCWVWLLQHCHQQQGHCSQQAAQAPHVMWGRCSGGNMPAGGGGGGGEVVGSTASASARTNACSGRLSPAPCRRPPGVAGTRRFSSDRSPQRRKACRRRACGSPSA